MLGQQFYHESIRKVIVSFGTMFNNINLVRKDNSGNISQSMKVPLAYGPREKFLVRLNEDADLTKQVAITLPRIGFEIQNLEYDSARKLNRVQRFKKVKGAEAKDADFAVTSGYLVDEVEGEDTTVADTPDAEKQSREAITGVIKKATPH